eukprot:CAMPEP_0175963842 /NCGR_PEP_ID=MMETSP0108-20121206/37239_1 /TAXON_ID=195067 ORGANISM="Goniomonas pacifica, Strain CCMP1869" /NCGR_SAMPLE_ID=MMETSP0108 /ASSEMBLY_ACC=CAM_ASM_000204 /LENGTH=222 /DNA_ID=CAMNT_0017291775 /DNA_START=21 /DNA_END=687 /DNA_ORIENTATION=-
MENAFFGLTPTDEKKTRRQISRPEQNLSAEAAADGLVGVVCFGSLLFELATGEQLVGPGLDDLPPAVSPEVARILQSIFSPSDTLPTLQSLHALPFFQTAKLPSHFTVAPASDLVDEADPDHKLISSLMAAVDASRKRAPKATPGSFAASLRLNAGKGKPSFGAGGDRDEGLDVVFHKRRSTWMLARLVGRSGRPLFNPAAESRPPRTAAASSPAFRLNSPL